jgi:hypothetical protein
MSNICSVDEEVTLLLHTIAHGADRKSFLNAISYTYGMANKIIVQNLPVASLWQRSASIFVLAHNCPAFYCQFV